MLKVQPLPSNTLALKALNDSILSPLLPNDTLRTILEQLMIIEWRSRADFDGYYAECAPLSCSYTTTEQLSIIYTITVTIGTIGGLSVTFQLLILIIARLILSITIIRSEWQAMELRGKIT